MITLEDLKIMNETLITFYENSIPKNEKKILKHKIIQEILDMEGSLFKMNKDEVMKIFSDIGIKEKKREEIYYNIVIKNITEK